MTLSGLFRCLYQQYKYIIPALPTHMALHKHIEQYLSTNMAPTTYIEKSFWTLYLKTSTMKVFLGRIYFSWCCLGLYVIMERTNWCNSRSSVEIKLLIISLTKVGSRLHIFSCLLIIIITTLPILLPPPMAIGDNWLYIFLYIMWLFM